MTALRVLVSGSRNWDRPGVVRDVLDVTVAEFCGTQVAVVHGNSGRVDLGADAHAKQRGWLVEAHPADWAAPCGRACRNGHRKSRASGTSYCPAAGVYRNQRMVDTRPDLLLVFIRDHSTGAEDCLRRGLRAGIPTRAVYDCPCHNPDGTACRIGDQLVLNLGGTHT